MTVFFLRLVNANRFINRQVAIAANTLQRLFLRLESIKSLQSLGLKVQVRYLQESRSKRSTTTIRLR